MTLPPEWSRIAALGFDSIASDALWIRFIQRMPMRPAGAELGASLAADLRGVVALDPQFRSAYMHGSVLLSVLGDEPCAALEIASEGGRAFPDDWRLPFQAGYTCFVDLSDDACGARHMERAATLPGAPRWLPGLVARLMAGSGNSEAAITYLKHQVSTTRDPVLKARFEDRLRDAILTRDFELLENAKRRFVVERGEPPKELADLIDAKLIPAVPSEPFGGRYVLLANGRVGSTSGRGALGAKRIQSHPKVLGFDIRLEGRVGRALPEVYSPMLERLAAKTGSAGAILVPLALLEEIEDDPERLETLRILQARVLVHIDVQRLRDAQLSLLHSKGSPPALEEIVEEARVPRVDPYGLAYMMEDGRPAAHDSSNPITFVADASGRRIAESERCN